MSGMDFKLGSPDDEQHATVPAIEITKFIQTEDGNLIETTNTHDINVNIYYHKNGDPNTVVNAGIDSRLSEEGVADLLIGYSRTPIHHKQLTVGKSGIGAIYDYDIDNGMIFISEDENSVDKDLVDSEGNKYQYVQTKIDTEYAWRTNGDEDKMHQAQGFFSIPEIVGPYSYNGNTSLKNTFLEFYIYNIYKPKTYPVIIKKVDTANPSANTGLSGAEFDLYGPYEEERTTDTNEAQTGRKETKFNSAVITTGTEGTVKIGDLANGIYYLYETKAPNGYIIIKSPIKIVVDSKNEGTNNPVLAYYQDDSSIDSDGSSSGLKYITKDSANQNLSEPYFELSVTNSSGVVLPNTGGTGSKTIYIFGFILTGFAGAGLVIQRKRKEY